jgi:hypothetical protein
MRQGLSPHRRKKVDYEVEDEVFNRELPDGDDLPAILRKLRSGSTIPISYL